MCGLCSQVLDWIENHGEAFLSKHTGVGKSLHRARALQKRHEDFEEVAQVTFCNYYSHRMSTIMINCLFYLLIFDLLGNENHCSSIFAVGSPSSPLFFNVLVMFCWCISRFLFYGSLTSHFCALSLLLIKLKDCSYICRFPLVFRILPGLTRSFLILAQNTYTNADKLLEAAEQLAQTGECDPEEIYQAAHQLEDRIQDFVRRVEQRKVLLDMSVAFHTHVKEVGMLPKNDSG